ncbi:MAG: alpha/beta fold hydrolase [Agathobacter sp.]|nr:alpha/beta fold hydrolase [Agathobacter sp.]
MTKQVWIKSLNGYTLRGVATIPDTVEKMPVVINIHGFGGNKCGYKNLHVQMARELEKAGIACVRFDMYGNGESDGEFCDMTFTSLLEDAEDIYNWVLEQDWTDKNHVILSGQSMGGYVAACAAPKLKPAKLVLQCPGANMWDGALDRALAMEEKGIFSADIEGLSFSTAFNKDLHQYEPFSTAKGYEGSVLLIRGTEDKLVDNATCEKYMEVYGDACTFVELEGGNHNFSSIPVREKLFQSIVDFSK